MKKTKGTLLLLLAALIWGMAFVVQTAAADAVGPFTFNAVRSFVGALFLLAVIGVRSRRPAGQKPDAAGSKRAVLAGAACGAVLFCAVNFQQFGIALYPEGVAAAGRSGFLTATYVVMVALCARLSGKRLHPLVAVAAAGCLAGMYLLCLSGGFSGVYLGDVLELLCAVSFTGHILIIDRHSGLDSVKMSCVQFFVCGALSLLGAALTEPFDGRAILNVWYLILYMGVLSSGVAYTLQMVGQKTAEPAVASIVMSLESVFAALAGWAVLGERLSPREFIGCVLVFAAVILAQTPAFLKEKTA